MMRFLTSILDRRAQRGKSGLTERFATWMDYRRFAVILKSSQYSKIISSEASKYLGEIEKNGICVVPGYWSEAKCSEARAEVERIINEYPEYLYEHAKADKRVYGANNVSDLIDSFNNDKVLGQVATAYNHKSSKAAFTLAAKLPATEGNLGSGEGWHRDAFFRQFKAILYLSDVNLNNGPFQMIKDSHKTSRVISDMKFGRLGYMQYRLTVEAIERILAVEPDRLITYPAKAGTLILVDTSTIHRGKPINEGVRYALTNYYYPVQNIDAAMFEKFKVLQNS